VPADGIACPAGGAGIAGATAAFWKRWTDMVELENSERQLLSAAVVNKKSLGQQVFEILESWIIEGKLAPGTRLTAEVIAKQLGVSRSPVREAIFELQRMGLAERWSFHDFRVFMPTEKFVLDLFDLSVILEAGQMYFASLKATPGDIADIAELLRQMAEAQDDKERYATLSHRLSALFKTGYDNGLLKDLLIGHDKYLRWLEHAYYTGEANSTTESHADHVVIFEKFRARDLAGLVGTLQLHMYKHRARVLEMLFRDLPPAKRGRRRAAASAMPTPAAPLEPRE
jgi:DNA-binding GntR family transcriptional regulator